MLHAKEPVLESKTRIFLSKSRPEGKTAFCVEDAHGGWRVENRNLQSAMPPRYLR